MTLQRRDHEGVGESQPGVQIGGEAEQLFVLDRVDLVDHEDLRRLELRQAFKDRLGLLVQALARVDQQADDVGVARPAPGRGDHGAVEPALRRENARRIDEDDLRRAVERDAAHEGARRLDLARHDRDLGPDQLVQQRRLAGVGRADQRAETATRSLRLVVHSPSSQTRSRTRNFCALACSAKRLELPCAMAVS